MRQEVKNLLDLMTRYPSADLYECGDRAGRSSGYFALTNPAPQTAKITAAEVTELEKLGIIEKKWPPDPYFYTFAKPKEGG